MMPWLMVALGLVILLLAGDALVKGAVNLSLRIGIPALIVSLTVVAFGTSAPELLISVNAVLDDKPGLGLGNVVGSNTANILLVLGVPALMIKEFFYGNLPDPVVVQKILGGINHTTLLAIPFFVLAAELMGEGQIARRLTGLVKVLVGHLRGGMGYTTIGGSMAFGSVSGSAPATVAAMARMVYPEMRKAGFSDKFSLGLIVSSAESGENPVGTLLLAAAR